MTQAEVRRVVEGLWSLLELIVEAGVPAELGRGDDATESPQCKEVAATGPRRCVCRPVPPTERVSGSRPDGRPRPVHSPESGERLENWHPEASTRGGLRLFPWRQPTLVLLPTTKGETAVRLTLASEERIPDIPYEAVP